MTTKELTGKVAVVTGAGRNIGRAIALTLADGGASVVVNARSNRVEAEAVVREIEAAGGKALVHIGDIANPTDVQAMADAAITGFGRIDILINNAGVEEKCDSRSVPESLWDRIVDTNLKAAFFCAQAAAMRMQGGSIVNVCSLTSEVGVPKAAAYGASKSGLAGLTRALATEWASSGIRVNGIGPGYFRTALTASFYDDENWQRRMLDRIPMRRFGHLEDLGDPVVFLCSEAAAYITGQILYIDGGYLASI
jgi:NAD(P)-dependent dehydrogenase (short-subunit alcohol dehydrogenase family)